MSVREARMELEAEGYRFDRVIDVLPWQHVRVQYAGGPRVRSSAVPGSSDEKFAGPSQMAGKISDFVFIELRPARSP